LVTGAVSTGPDPAGAVVAALPPQAAITSAAIVTRAPKRSLIYLSFTPK
jgi:hypothetical protein